MGDTCGGTGCDFVVMEFDAAESSLDHSFGASPFSAAIDFLRAQIGQFDYAVRECGQSLGGFEFWSIMRDAREIISVLAD